MATTSRIPAAIDALLAAARTALPAVSVVDGPPLSWDGIQLADPADAVSERAYLFVGADLDSDVSAAGEQDFNAAGAVSRDETFAVSFVAYAWNGDPKVKDRRDEAFAIVSGIESALRGDPALAGAVLYSRVATVGRVAQRQTEGGSDCSVEFTVACRAYLS